MPGGQGEEGVRDGGALVAGCANDEDGFLLGGRHGGWREGWDEGGD